MLSLALAVVCVFLSIIFLFIKWRYQYWKRRNIKGPTPELLIGNVGPIINKTHSIVSLACSYYNEYPDEKIVGIYQGLEVAAIIRDPELIRHVVIKDFSNFVNRGFKLTDESFTKSLFLEDGDNWRILRQQLSPIFTSGKLKQMMPLLNKCVNDLVAYTDKMIKSNGPYELKSVTNKYSLKGITSCAFGLDIDTFFTETCQFREMADKMLKPNFKTALIGFLNTIFPGIGIKLKLELSNPIIRHFFLDLVLKIMQEREGKPKIRRDFMDLLIEMKEEGIVMKTINNKVSQLEINETLIAAQAVTFYAAGFETTSSTMSFLFFELAHNPHVQEKCYNEIKEVMEKYNGVLTYESLKDLKYVLMTFEETLRKHPITGLVFRQCQDDYTFPDTNIKIERGTKIIVPLLAIQNDEKYFKDPEVFDPERFTPENRANIKPCVYMPFGEGPRNCIGLRFAKVQGLLGIAHFLYNFKVELSERSGDKIEYDAGAPTLVSKNGIWLHLSKR